MLIWTVKHDRSVGRSIKWITTCNCSKSVSETSDICFSATYNLSIKVGDVKGSGTDGNVYIQLFGERGNTAKIQLRQAGDTRNKFEKGRTYKFTVDTVDIGKVQYIAQNVLLLFSFSTNLIVFFHGCHFIIGYATCYLFCCC